VEAHATKLTAVEAPSASSRLAERPVFVADRGWRHLLVRAMIVLGAALIAAWLIALVAGALGWGNLPGLPFSEGAGHGQSGGASSQARPAAETTAAQKGPSGVANRAISPSAAGSPTSSRSPGPSLPAPVESRSPNGALSTPTKTGAGSQSPAGSSSPPAAGPETPAGSGSQQNAGSPGATSSPGATTPSNGAGREAGNGGNAAPSFIPRESGRPAVTPSGTVPAEYAHGGNPDALALAYGQGGNPAH
jgi:hypothetical protein